LTGDIRFTTSGVLRPVDGVAMPESRGVAGLELDVVVCLLRILRFGTIGRLAVSRGRTGGVVSPYRRDSKYTSDRSRGRVWFAAKSEPGKLCKSKNQLRVGDGGWLSETVAFDSGSDSLSVRWSSRQLQQDASTIVTESQGRKFHLIRIGYDNWSMRFD